MALKKLKWLKYLFVSRTEAETEQNYWNEKRKRHLKNEHSEGIVVGLDVTEDAPPSLKVKVHGGNIKVETTAAPSQPIDLIELTVSGELMGGGRFSGTDAVRVMLKKHHGD